MAAVEVRSRTSPEVNGHAPDPRALAVVSVLQSRLPDTQEVVLFGSRAMGNWRSWSDLDLAVIGVPGDRDSEDSLHQQAEAIAKDQCGHEAPAVQIFPFPRSEFEACRTSHPHIAGQVQYWGITATGDPLPHMTQDNPWPEVQAHLQSAHNDLGNALFNLNGGQPQFAVALRSAHGALEHCFKALLGVAKVKFLHNHKLEELAPKMPYVPGAQADGFPDTEWLKALMRFGEQSPYAGANPPWPDESSGSIVEQAQHLCGSLAQSTLDLMHKHPTDVGYETLYDRDAALGGVESLPLDHFSLRESMERFGTAKMLEGAVANTLEYLDKVPLQGRLQLRDAWLEAGETPNPNAVMAVMMGQAEWRTLLPEGLRDEGDDHSRTPPEPSSPLGTS